jgi:hypothetical protein
VTGATSTFAGGGPSADRAGMALPASSRHAAETIVDIFLKKIISLSILF